MKMLIFARYNVVSVKPLEENEAIQKGINFISEVTVFAIGGTILCVEVNGIKCTFEIDVVVLEKSTAQSRKGGDC